MNKEQPTARIVVSCKARPEAVYGLLADLRTHLDWAGSRQSPDFRLLTLDAPAGVATAGTRFSSTGTIPMSSRRFADLSTVTVAEAPRRFAFTTEARAGSMTATYGHDYEIEPEASGSRVTYTLSQLAIANPTLRMALPVVRQMTWRVAVPMFAGRGLRNLVTMAEERTKSEAAGRAPAAAHRR